MTTVVSLQRHELPATFAALATTIHMSAAVARAPIIVLYARSLGQLEQHGLAITYPKRVVCHLIAVLMVL